MRGLYAIVDVTVLGERGLDPIGFANEVLSAGPAALQLRAKDLSPRETLRLLRELRPLCAARGVPLFANDRPDLAKMAACDGVHVGQDDLPVREVRRFAPELRVGVSTHDLHQLESALLDCPDYAALGPVFATTSKARPDPVVGLDGLGRAAEIVASRVPLVAIGGIDLERAPRVARYADAVAVISALLPAGGASALTRVELFVKAIEGR